MCQLVRDSKLAQEIDDDLEEQKLDKPRTREGREAHAAHMAQRAEDRKR